MTPDPEARTTLRIPDDLAPQVAQHHAERVELAARHGLPEPSYTSTLVCLIGRGLKAASALGEVSRG